jgi:hypothetical protein
MTEKNGATLAVMVEERILTHLVLSQRWKSGTRETKTVVQCFCLELLHLYLLKVKISLPQALKRTQTHASQAFICPQTLPQEITKVGFICIQSSSNNEPPHLGPCDHIHIFNNSPE